MALVSGRTGLVPVPSPYRGRRDHGTSPVLVPHGTTGPVLRDQITILFLLKTDMQPDPADPRPAPFQMNDERNSALLHLLALTQGHRAEARRRWERADYPNWILDETLDAATARSLP